MSHKPTTPEDVEVRVNRSGNLQVTLPSGVSLVELPGGRFKVEKADAVFANAPRPHQKVSGIVNGVLIHQDPAGAHPHSHVIVAFEDLSPDTP